MNKIFKLLIMVLILEICLGYLYYHKRLHNFTGNYISSIFLASESQTFKKFINPFKEFILDVQKQRAREAVTVDRVREVTIADRARAANVSVYANADAGGFTRGGGGFISHNTKESRKEILENNKIKVLENCNPNSQTDFTISTLRAHRSPIRIQSSLRFINTENFKDKYLIAIGGNSETFGKDQEIKLHTLLEKKLNEQFNTDKIFVINVANFGYQLKDQIITLEYIASDLYPVDLSILYTGGNLFDRDEIILQRIIQGEDLLNIKNENLFLPIEESSEYGYCVNKNNFITKIDTIKYYNKTLYHKSDSYLIRNFKKMKEKFNITRMNYLFFIHPFNENFLLENPKKNEKKKKILESLKNIKITDERFFNLTNDQIKLDFSDFFHTRDIEPIADIILEKIINLESEKILNKI